MSSSQQNEVISNDTTALTIKTKGKNKRVIHSSSSSDEEEAEKISPPRPKRKKALANKKVLKWDKDFKKELVCTVCNSHWQTKKAFLNHSHTHDALRAKYKNIFNKQCSVILVKIDGKPNVTGESNIVVFDKNKMIEFGDMDFHTVYSRNPIIDENPLEKNNELKLSNESNLGQYKSDDDYEIVTKRKSRSLRLFSRSSNDTVVLENCAKNEISDNDCDSRTASQCSDGRPVTNNDVCINIDDSDSESNSGNVDSSKRVKLPMEAKIGDYKIIQGIISTCVNAYQKKNEVADIDAYINVMRNKTDKVLVVSQLKHKLLSIGRKIINKQGFNCTGLLRFMEHKNLDVIWITKPFPVKPNKDTNYIRILTKLRENETSEDYGWKFVIDNNVHDDNMAIKQILTDTSSGIPSGTNLIQDACTPEKNPKPNESNPIEPKPVAPKPTENVQQNVMNKKTEIANTPAVLYVNTNSNASNVPKKILNANPVANPKLLPKKSVQSNDRANKPLSATQPKSRNDTDAGASFSMPIITCTASLASSTTEEQNKQKEARRISAGGTDVVTTAPRIKVKPVSELMSERTLNSLRNENMINENILKENTASSTTNITKVVAGPIVWPLQQPFNIFVPNMSSSPIMASQPVQPVVANQPVQQVQTLCGSLPSPDANIPELLKDCPRNKVMLDTVEFPNTTTESPFKYLKDLLQLHSLVLLNSRESLSPDFSCLIKFKVLFQKENSTDKPIVLCLLMFCFKNIFCLRVRDEHQREVDFAKLSANWQWEILQIYRGEVVTKILQNAQRVGNESYGYTTNFFCLLKSINCKGYL